MDLIKHASVFSPERVSGNIGVVGVGALGSALALQLAKLGLTNLVLFDDDIVEAHNLPNQILYGPEDLGRHKVLAAAETIESLTGYLPQYHSHRFESKTDTQVSDITHLFVCVDSMSAREAIFRQAVWLNPELVYFNEGRMNARSGMVTAFDPSDIAKSREYQGRLYPDSEVELDRGTCGNILSIGATATTLACQMTWHLINWYAQPERLVPWEELIISISDLTVHSKGHLTHPLTAVA